MKTSGGALSGWTAAFLAAAITLQFVEAGWLRFLAWAALVVALVAGAAVLAVILGRGMWAALRIVASGGFAMLYPELKAPSHRPPLGTWRHAIYTGGLGVLETPSSRRHSEEARWIRNR